MNSMLLTISRWKKILLFVNDLIIVGLIEGLAEPQGVKEADHQVKAGNLVEEVGMVGHLVKSGGVYQTG